MAWNHTLSNTMRTIGAIPYMFIVFAPSLILTVFNIYFNLSVFETVGVALELSYTYYQKLKWFVYLSSILLIMRPLIEQLFSSTQGSISATEQSYLTMMKYVGIGIIGIGGLAYIMSYIIGDIQVNEYKTIANPSWIQSFLGLDQEISGKRSINGFEVILDLSAMAASYFTETLAGFMLITSKDILFPEKQSGSKAPAHKPTLPKNASDIVTRVQDLANMTPDEIVVLLGDKSKLYSEKNRIKTFNQSLFDGFDKEKAIFNKTKDEVIKKIDEAIALV